jgi:hypothetical protein
MMKLESGNSFAGNYHGKATGARKRLPLRKLWRF